MPIFSKIRPLQSGEKIADREGRATPTFALLWQQLFGNSDFLDEGKQDADEDLSALAALNSQGIVVRRGAADFTTRTLEGGAGVTITYPNGVDGNPLIEIESSGGTYIPLVDGAEPPSFITDGAGQLILVPWSPL